jgi:hypothetical protein
VAHLCDWLVSGGVDLVHTPLLPGRTSRAASPRFSLRDGGLGCVAHYDNVYDEVLAGR